LKVNENLIRWKTKAAKVAAVEKEKEENSRRASDC
jgi:hypothetical protein